MFNVEGSRITIQGLGLGDCDPILSFPSGLIPESEDGSQLSAVLGSLSASFGYNTTAHQFNTIWIPDDKYKCLHGASGNLPLAGTTVGFNVGDFLVSGQITHADYTASGGQGTIIKIDIEDTRNCLDKIKIHTEDLDQNPGQSGIVSVARGYRIKRGLRNIDGHVDDDLFFEYRNILENGCTYPQILEAIQLAVDEGEIEFDLSILPSIQQLEANIGGDASALRFQFVVSPLSQAITSVCSDAAYDWYWSMSNNAVQLVNRKTTFELNEQSLLDVIANVGASGLARVKSLSYGGDLIDEPRRFRLLGAKQEGFINSDLVGPIDGLNTRNSGLIFYPAWRNITISFYDAGGFLRSYTPSDLELKMALNGIETWTYFKIYQTTPTNPVSGPSGFGMAPDAGSIAAQHPDFQSRLDPSQPLAGMIADNEEGSYRLIDNRRDENSNWTLDFFNRVQDHTNRHFGRSYVASGLLVTSASGKFNLVDSAWANVENQIEGQPLSVNGSSGLFIPRYEINRDLGPLSPFKTVDEKIRAYCKLPSGTVYGPEGDDSPASFAAWTEDAPTFNPSGDGSHYIPIQLNEVGQETIDPRGGLDTTFESYEDGTVLCQLPTIASSGLSQDFVLGNLVTLIENALSSKSSGLLDIADSSILVNPYEQLTGVAVPVQAPVRYGMGFPSYWVSGELAYPCDNERVEVDDSFAPWNFPPQGTRNSLDLLQDRAFRKIQGTIINARTAQFANVDIVGMPSISFDGFANQDRNDDGAYGTRSHGVTNLNFSFGGDGYSTSYRIASYFTDFGREAPLGRRNRAILNGILNPINYTEFRLGDNLTPPRNQPRPNPLPTSVNATSANRVNRTKVTITSVNNVLTLSSIPDLDSRERYRGSSARGIINPPVNNFTSTLDFKDGAICEDGFLNIGDEAIYIVEEILTTRNGSPVRDTLRYFQGGRPFGNGTIVSVHSAGSTSGSFNLLIDNTNPVRLLANVEVLNGTVDIGSRSTVVAEGNVQRYLGRTEPDLSIPGVYVNGVSSSRGRCVVTSVTNQGTGSATLTVKLLDVDGNPTGDFITDVVPAPYPEFILVGDIGLFVNTQVAAGAIQVSQKLFFSSRENFIAFS